MTPPELGKTAAEIMGALAPVLERNADQVSRLADQLTQMNGTVRGLCEWRATVNERHRQEDEQPPPPATEPAASKNLEVRETINLVLTWCLRFTLAGAALVTSFNLEKVAQVLLSK